MPGRTHLTKLDKEATMLKQPNRRDLAQMMIRRHGLRAQAVALERAAEMRQQGDTLGLHLWQHTHSVIAELRRTAGLRAVSGAAAS
jgi:hypothetical protein